METHDTESDILVENDEVPQDLLDEIDPTELEEFLESGDRDLSPLYRQWVRLPLFELEEEVEEIQKLHALQEQWRIACDMTAEEWQEARFVPGFAQLEKFRESGLHSYNGKIQKCQIIFDEWHAQRTKICSHNIRAVVRLAGRFAKFHKLPLADLIQLGTVGLLQGIDRYKLGKRTRLASYAFWHIRRTMQDGLREHTNNARRQYQSQIDSMEQRPKCETVDTRAPFSAETTDQRIPDTTEALGKIFLHALKVTSMTRRQLNLMCAVYGLGLSFEVNGNGETHWIFDPEQYGKTKTMREVAESERGEDRQLVHKLVTKARRHLRRACGHRLEKLF